LTSINEFLANSLSWNLTYDGKYDKQAILKAAITLYGYELQLKQALSIYITGC